MISAHKIQESLDAYKQLFRPLPANSIGDPELEALNSQKYFVNQASELLDAAVKFDVGEITLNNVQPLIDTGKECAAEGLLSLPFERTYIEGTIIDNGAKKRFCSLFAPATECIDKAVVERLPHIGSGTARLNFVQKEQNVRSHISWEIPTLIPVYSKDFKDIFLIPAAKSLTDFAAITDEIFEDIMSFNTSTLYILHSLINARGVEIQSEPAPSKLNKKRSQKGKPLLYEHFILKIGGFSSSGRVLGVGATHASPRSHWRRGHIRTIRRGTAEEKRIVIAASLVNGHGFVSKDYETKNHAPFGSGARGLIRKNLRK